MKALMTIVGLVFLTVLIGSCMFTVFLPSTTATSRPNSSPQSSPAPTQPPITIDKSEAAQAQRWKLINALCDQGVFKEVKYTVVARVVVGSGFGATNFEQRQSFAEVVWAVYYDADDYNDFGSVVTYRDPQTDKELGTYHPKTGLRMN